jgi:2'-5' RNA ligase
VFAAIEIPDDIRPSLVRLRQPLPGARWQDASELHLTLRFAGDIEVGRADDFADALDRVAADAFELRLAGLAAFGGHDPRVIYAGVERSEPLELLARACERAARSAGLQPETRQFKPHVTLARLNGTPPDAVARVLQRLGAFRSEAFFVPRFVLMSSRPNVGGGPYVIEAAYALRGGYGGDAEEV